MCLLSYVDLQVYEKSDAMLYHRIKSSVKCLVLRTLLRLIFLLFWLTLLDIKSTDDSKWNTTQNHTKEDQK